MQDLHTQPDVSNYPKAPEAQSQASNDPYHSLVQAIQLRNAMNSINKVQGGMQGTQESLDNLGAGQPHN